jgi:putative ABC transport system permease protein
MTLFKLALRGVRARPGRFLLTSLAVLVGVALTSAVFVFTDSLRETFGALSSDIESGYDVAVRSEIPFGERDNAAPVPIEVRQLLEGIDDVARVQPRVIDFGVVPTDGDGEPITGNGPNIGVNWDEATADPTLFPNRGRPPATSSEFAIEDLVAKDNDLVIGETYTVQTRAGAADFTLVGTLNFADPEETAIAGAVLIAFETETATQLLNEGVGYDDITVTFAEGADAEAVTAAVADAIPDGLEVVPVEDVAAEQAAEFNEFIDIFRTILLVFAFVILLVAAFIIYNVFSIVVGQRIQEIGLLRALGATGQQVTQSIALEAFLVGVFATVVGVLLGLPIAAGLQALLAALDFGPDNLSTPLRPTTVIVGAFLGVGLTMTAAIWPALRARQVSPMAALRADVQPEQRTAPNRVLGTILTLAGILAVVTGFVLDEYLLLLILTVVASILIYLGTMRLNDRYGRFSLVAMAAVLVTIAMTADLRASMLLALLGASALTAFLGLNLVSPMFATPAARFLGAPIGKLGVPGRLARENAGRNPQRTATAASALMVGLALVTTVAVVAASFKATFADVLNDSVSADLIVLGNTDGPPGTGGFSPEVAAAIAQLPEIASVLSVQYLPEQFATAADLEARNAYATELETVEEHFDPEIVEVDPSLFGSNGVLLHTDEADDLGVGVGSTFEIELVDRTTTELTVAGLFDNRAIFDTGWVVDSDLLRSSLTTVAPLDLFVTAIGAEGIDAAESKTAVEEALARFAQLDTFTKEEFQAEQESQIDQTLTVVNVLLFVSVILALLGVAITLALSVFERTREIGLTRAVGGTRRQVKRMVRGEGVIVALFGGVLGVGLGVVFGAACVQIIPDDFVSTLSIPWGSMITYMIVAAFAGLLAAYFPARRAAKLNVLEAISYE